MAKKDCLRFRYFEDGFDELERYMKVFGWYREEDRETDR